MFGLLVLNTISLFHQLDFLPFKFTEPRRALFRCDMGLSGDWIKLTIYGLTYCNKPSLYNWVLTVFMNVFGHSDWVIPLPTLLQVITLVRVEYWLRGQKVGQQAALWSTIFIASISNICFYFSFQGRIDIV